MKKIFFLLLFFSTQFVFSQVLKPISWKSTSSVSQLKTGETLDLIFTADINPNWYLYSSDFDPDLGPIVTTFAFKKNDTYQLIGKLKPINAQKKFDDLWGGEYTYFKKKAEFRQTIKLLKTNPKIEVSASYQVCSDVDGKCINLEEDFVFDKIQVTESPQTSTENTLSETQNPENKEVEKIDSLKKDSSTTAPTSQNLPENTSKKPIEVSVTPAENEKPSLWAFMLSAFIGGLFALLTPCVFPMIPMTVSFFTKKSKSRSEGIFKALLYGISIVGIYTFMGFVVSLVWGAEAANLLATHWLPNILFFLIFMIFAFSFFGMFEIVLPHSWANKADEQADKGGIMGIFFMAFTLVLVSFSCTGPIVGTILVAAAGGEVLKPVLGMVAFSSAFAVPFTLFAIFPSWLSHLPKSGSWLNSVKVVLGFVELALAFKFLSVADQVEHWGLLDRHIYIAIWLAISIGLFLYLIGKIRLPHDSPTEHIGVPRLLFALTVLSFIVYLSAGMVGAPLKALAGYLPPQTTHDFDLLTLLQNRQSTENQVVRKKVKYSEFLKLPHGLFGYFDYKEALEAAKEAKKPLFIDFTGHGCVNCREMEARIWSNPEVLRRLQNDFIVVALYVDDRHELPENEWITSKYDGKVKKTIGKINSDRQISLYNNNAQSYYVLLDNNENLLVQPKAYDLNVENFVEFLDKASTEFKNR